MWLTVTALTVWIMDTGAYFIGVRFGHHKLWPRISPKKSWEGFWGGLGSATLAAALMAHFWLPGVSAWQGALLGVLVGCVGPLGDLSESLFKRQSGVKDSSQLIPGHGGVLDRVDSFIFVAPAVYLLTQMLGW
jgi:phosphatidate cytidylyltransferase